MGLLERVKERDTGIGDCTIVDAAGVPYAVMPSVLYAGELEVLIDELIGILHDRPPRPGSSTGSATPSPRWNRTTTA